MKGGKLLWGFDSILGVLQFGIFILQIVDFPDIVNAVIDKAMALVRGLASTFPSAKRLFCSIGSGDLARAIAEMNKEMEDVFGDLPAADFSGSRENNITTQEPQGESLKCGGNVHGLTHVGSSGEARMVDVSQKDVSTRTASASCKVILGKEVFDLVHSNQITKGDVLTVAKIAGISGAKQTSNLIPLCHNILLTHVDVELKLNSQDNSVEIKGVASCSGKTGVEMEAMTAASIAGLTVYDMCKAASKDIHISYVLLESKTGGKSGDWYRRK